jgi:hypothetical protein
MSSVVGVLAFILFFADLHPDARIRLAQGLFLIMESVIITLAVIGLYHRVELLIEKRKLRRKEKLKELCMKSLTFREWKDVETLKQEVEESLGSRVQDEELFSILNHFVLDGTIKRYPSRHRAYKRVPIIYQPSHSKKTSRLAR